jgi:hypothetical protein
LGAAIKTNPEGNNPRFSPFDHSQPEDLAAIVMQYQQPVQQLE